MNCSTAAVRISLNFALRAEGKSTPQSPVVGLPLFCANAANSWSSVWGFTGSQHTFSRSSMSLFFCWI